MPENAPKDVGEVLSSGFVSTGTKTDEFEQEIGTLIGNPHVVATNCCSSAIMLALYMAGIRQGDDVISTPLTCLSVNESLLHTGANIVWADIDPETGNISPESIQDRITGKTKAIVYSHWVGRLADIGAINQIAHTHNLKTIEDAASALGGEYDGKPVGTHSDYVAFSFQAVKHITTGDGGLLAVRTQDERERALLLRNHGNDRHAKRSPLTLGFDVYEAGWKYQMNDIAAVLGLSQLKALPEIRKISRRNLEIYKSRLANVPGLTILKEYDNAKSNPWVNTVLVENRSDFINKLQEHKIGCSIVHMRNDQFSVFSQFQKDDLPALDCFYEQMINIPVGWWMSEEMVHNVCDVITSGW
ncbi:MAG: DegT/DnrJ/EryC1/StrS family aminotransferase [Desulfuromonadaceae bacterium]|nr:DegT/DnrJ/EryC1/StrS family aminotransferase [Desulfuromonadaceae bacterium]MDD5106904.1 DegT/DnrJ/EryC1/StrS family aminotransferase [Desulfuromonadaceae bacterium]